jgi:hypothetical protein
MEYIINELGSYIFDFIKREKDPYSGDIDFNALPYYDSLVTAKYMYM